VDDGLLICPTDEEVEDILNHLKKEFEIKISEAKRCMEIDEMEDRI
jgi:hypothetical protein